MAMPGSVGYCKQAWVVEEMLKRCCPAVDPIEGQTRNVRGKRRTKMEQRWAKRGRQDGFQIGKDAPTWGQERAGRSPENVAAAGRFGVLHAGLDC